MDNLSNAGQDELEELSKTFSFKLADKLEKHEIDIDKACRLMQEFLQLVESANTSGEIKKFIDGI
ncbi:MAG: hypothetical protein HY813_00540 [Candidatus Portnoybacteria bacterium]|nr:hypothetical protein [Candidatus Portnoybacteria bacterium]